MPVIDIIKAWKDEDYRERLSAEQRAQLPEHPSGVIEFQESELRQGPPLTHKCCFKFTR